MIRWGLCVRFEPLRRQRRRPGRRFWLIASLGVVAVVFFVGFVASALQRAPAATPLPPFPTAAADPNQAPLAFTYFYYWYDLPGGTHSGALTDRPADANASYRDVGWFKTQLTDMNDAGIDVALADYWGPAEPSSDVGLANMAQASHELTGAGAPSPKIGMFLDTGLIGRWPQAQRDLTKTENQQRFYDLVHTFFSILPRDEWALVDGRPVLWMWASWFDISFDQSFFDNLSSRFQADFGVRPYVVAEASWRFATLNDGSGLRPDPSRPIRIDNFYVWGAALNGFRDAGAGVAEVGPGYDERQLDGPGRSGRYAPRDGGSFYEEQLAGALASKRRFIAIETWDEFHEASDIADSTEYGRMYIELTRRYLDRFGAGAAARSVSPEAQRLTAN
jgi:Domain of unknown function (DUF5010)